MATPDQATFITDLILAKHRDFRTFKKWLATTGIVRTNGQIFSKSMNLKAILNRLSTAQATAIIEAMQPLTDVHYQTAYDPKDIETVGKIMDDIEQEIQSWTFI